MQALPLSKKLSRPLFIASTSPFRLLSNLFAASSSSSSPPPLSLTSAIFTGSGGASFSSTFNLVSSPWSLIQCRGIKVSGSDVRVGNIIEKQGRIYEVLKVEHSHEGRGKATMKVGFEICPAGFMRTNYSFVLSFVELRDVNHGNKVTQRLGTDENIERVFVQEKTFTYMCMDHDGTVVLMDPETLDQVELSRDLFGKNALYLRDEMKVKVFFYDDKPLSASVPKRVTCIVKEGIAATPRNKKVVLDNGLTVEVPPHIVAGDAIVVNTEEDSYMERAKA